MLEVQVEVLKELEMMFPHLEAKLDGLKIRIDRL